MPGPVPGVVTSMTGESSRAASLLSGAPSGARHQEDNSLAIRVSVRLFTAPPKRRELADLCVPSRDFSNHAPPLKAWKMFRKAGPAVMTKRAGMMQKTMGKSILTGAFWASS
jgi:hypothetical protein